MNKTSGVTVVTDVTAYMSDTIWW